MGAWNIQSIKKKEIELTKEFIKANIKILAITETKMKGQGSLELEDGHLLIYSGVEQEQRAAAGVACIIHSDLINKIQTWDCISERILAVVMNIEEGIKETIIIAYGPNEDDRAMIKDAFWEELQLTLDSSNGKIYILGDLNGRVGKDNTGVEDIMGTKGEETRNNNGKRLLDFCRINELLITNTIFDHKDIHKFTRVLPSRNEKSIIDYILIEKQERKLLCDVRVMRGPEIGSDHYLVKGKFKRSGPQKDSEDLKRKEVRKERIKVYRLKEEEVRGQYWARCEEEFRKWTNTKFDNVEVAWNIFKSTLIRVAGQICGTFKPKEHKKQTSWWNEEIKKAVREKKTRWANYLQKKDNTSYTKYKVQRKLVKEMVLEAKKKEWENFGNLLQGYSMQNKKLFYKIIKSNRVKKQPQLPQILDQNGEILSDPKEIMERWKSHFEELLEANNQESNVEDMVMEQNRSAEAQRNDISEEEVRESLQTLKIGKAAGQDDIKPEMVKYMGKNGMDLLCKIFNVAWATSRIPKDWEVAIIVPIFKKGDNKQCRNYRGISLLSVPAKIYEQILAKRLRNQVDGILEQSQSGFRKGYSVQDHIFALRQIQEKFLNHNKNAYLCFIDLTKAFDRVSRKQIWEILTKLNVEEQLICSIKSVYSNTRNVVRQGNLDSGEFITKEGLRQGSCLSPLLFIILLDDAIKEIKENLKSLLIGYDNLKPVQVTEFAFADDIVIFGRTVEDLQHNLNTWHKALLKRNMEINKAKTQVMKIGRESENFSVYLDSEELEQVERFKYLGAVIESKGKIEEEINNRIGNTAGLYASLRNILINKKEVSKRAKLLIYKSVYLPTLLYGCESWVLSKRLQSKIQAMEMKFLRRIEGVSRLDKIRNVHIREKLEVEAADRKIAKQQLRWLGHIHRLGKDRLTKRVWQARAFGRRPRGRPRQTWNGTISNILNGENMSWNSAKTLSQSKKEWRDFIKSL